MIRHKIVHITKGYNGGLDNISRDIFRGINNLFDQKVLYFYDYGRDFYREFENDKVPIFEWKKEVIFANILGKIKDLNKSDIIHVHHAKVWILLSPLIFFKKKTIYSFHGNFGYALDKNTFQKLVISLIINYSTLFSTKLIFLTDGQRTNLLRYSIFKKTLLKKSVIINNFISSDVIMKKMKKKTKFQVLFVGRYTQEKGFYDLIKLSNYFKDVKFCLIGDNYTPLNKTNIINIGIIKQSDIYKYYDQSTIFILPSYTEAFPITVLEAMARGLVVLISDIPGMREVVKEGKNGYFFKPGDMNAMRKILNDLIKNPSKVKRISLNNLSHIRNFLKENQIIKYVVLYNEMLRSNNGTQSNSDRI